MNKFAGNITISASIKVNENFEFDYIESMGGEGNKNIYVFGETDLKSSKELISYFETQFGKLVNSDISIEKEEKIELLPYDYEEGLYELVSFEGEEVNFNEIYNRFEEHDALFSVREAEISNKFGNKIIKVDFVY